MSYQSSAFFLEGSDVAALEQPARMRTMSNESLAEASLNDEELAAATAILQALAPLDPETRRRIIATAQAFYDLK
jgi:hypothetical protein